MYVTEDQHFSILRISHIPHFQYSDIAVTTVGLHSATLVKSLLISATGTQVLDDQKLGLYKKSTPDGYKDMFAYPKHINTDIHTHTCRLSYIRLPYMLSTDSNVRMVKNFYATHINCRFKYGKARGYLTNSSFRYTTQITFTITESKLSK